MQRILEELNNARGHVLIARSKLWQKREELPNYILYNDTHDALNVLEGIIITLERWRDKTCKKS